MDKKYVDTNPDERVTSQRIWANIETAAGPAAAASSNIVQHGQQPRCYSDGRANVYTRWCIFFFIIFLSFRLFVETALDSSAYSNDTAQQTWKYIEAHINRLVSSSFISKIYKGWGMSNFKMAESTVLSLMARANVDSGVRSRRRARARYYRHP